jgi:solute carrier family 25 phosphate transporter 3
VTFASGYLAGIFCAIISHPADTIVSKLNNMKTEGSLMTNVSKIYGDIGMAGLWRGLGTRIFMIGTLTGL